MTPTNAIRRCPSRIARTLWLRRTVSATIAACVALGTATAAASSLPRFEMQAALDEAGGKLIAAGDYAGAVELLSDDGNHPLETARVWRMTNLCVSQTLANRASAAVESCNEAIEDARQSAPPVTGARRSKDTLAVLYSNRAVAHWRSGNPAAAEADLAQAAALAPRFDLVRNNRAAVASRQAALTAAND
jgi:hypothetical protein